MSQQKKEIKSLPLNGLFTGTSNILLLAGIVILTFIIYSRSIQYDFVNWDDPATVYENKDITAFSAENLKKIFTSSYVGMYQPVTTLLYSAEYTIYKLNPTGYHLTGLILHFLNLILVFFLVIHLTGNKTVSFIVSLLFAIHPMHVESVAWVSERKDLVYTLFFLLSLIFYILYLKNTHKTRYLITSFFFAGISILSKSSAVVLPLVFIIFDLNFKRKTELKSILEKVPFFILSIVFGIISLRSQHAWDLTNETTSGFSLFERFFMACYAFSFYIVKLLLPFKLSAIYPFPESGQIPVVMYISPVFVALVTWLAIYTRKKHRIVFTGLLFYLVNVILIIQIIPVGQTITADRYSYVSYIGLFLVLGYFYDRIINKYGNRLNLVLIVFCLFLSIVTWKRIPAWKNSSALFSDVIKNYPEVATAWYNRGQIRLEKNDLERALVDFNEAVKLKPGKSNYLQARASVLYKTGNFKDALQDYESITINPDNKTEVFYGKGLCKAALNDLQGALQDFDSVISSGKPSYKVYNDRGIVRAKFNDLKGALDDFNKSIRLNPSDDIAFVNRASARGSLNDIKGAEEDIDKAISLNPDNSDAWFMKGMILFNRDNRKEACNAWQKSAKLGHKQASSALTTYCQ